MNRLCINCPGCLMGDCADCAEMEDPRGGDYDEDEFADEMPDRDEVGEWEDLKYDEQD